MYIMNPYQSQGLCLSKLHLTMFGFPKNRGKTLTTSTTSISEHRRFQTGFSPSVVQGLMFGATFSYLIFFRWATFKASFEPIKSHGFGRWTSGHPGGMLACLLCIKNKDERSISLKMVGKGLGALIWIKTMAKWTFPQDLGTMLHLQNNTEKMELFSDFSLWACPMP